MNRRRAILVVVVLAVASGAAWRLSTDRLSPEEQQLIGTWQCRCPQYGTGTIVFHANRQLSSYRVENKFKPDSEQGADFNCRWSFLNGVVYLDSERNAIRRVLRPAIERLGVKTFNVRTISVRMVGKNEFVMTSEDSVGEVWTRDRGD